jgi:ABC-type branched-subunit amino acid transport system substrate-binding protein
MRSRSASDSITTRDAVTLRYSMPPGDVDALLADPDHLGDGRKPGVFEDRIRLGVILPPVETMREASVETRAIVSAWFSDVNARGGIFGRAIELAFVDPSGSPSEVAAAVRAFLDRTALFALVCSFSEGTERELAELAEEKEIPFIATITSNPRSSSAPGRYLRELFAGLSEQSRALIRVAAEETPESKRIAIVSAGKHWTEVRDAAWREARANHYATVETIDAAALDPASLRDRGIDTMLLLDAGALDRLLRELESHRWMPTVLAPSSIADPDLLAHAPVRSLVSFPMLPSDSTESSIAMYTRLILEHRIATTHRATQTAALASASLATDALTRAGRNLTRDALLDAIDATRALRTGFAPPLTFRPDRHIGSTGCHIVAFEPGQPPRAAWVEVG